MAESNQEQPRRRGPGRPFQKGQSGNPGGRQKLEGDVRELAKTHTAAAIQRLADWMMSNHPQASVQAATALLNRAWGMPAQQIGGDAQNPVIHEIRRVIVAND